MLYSTLREVVLIPNRHWGGDGLLGCVFGWVSFSKWLWWPRILPSHLVLGFCTGYLLSQRIVSLDQYPLSFKSRTTSMKVRAFLFQQTCRRVKTATIMFNLVSGISNKRRNGIAMFYLFETNLWLSSLPWLAFPTGWGYSCTAFIQGMSRHWQHKMFSAGSCCLQPRILNTHTIHWLLIGRFLLIFVPCIK